MLNGRRTSLRCDPQRLRHAPFWNRFLRKRRSDEIGPINNKAGRINMNTTNDIVSALVSEAKRQHPESDVTPELIEKTIQQLLSGTSLREHLAQLDDENSDPDSWDDYPEPDLDELMDDEDGPPALMPPCIEDIYAAKIELPEPEYGGPDESFSDHFSGEAGMRKGGRDKKLDKLYKMVLSLSRNSGYAFAGDGYYAKELGVDRSWVRDGLKTLELKGFIKVENPYTQNRRIHPA